MTTLPVPTVLLDVLLALALLAYTVEGFHLGVARTLGRAVGIAVGGLLALRFGPDLLHRYAADIGATVPMFVLFAAMVVLGAMVGMAVVLWPIRRFVPVPRRAAGVADRVGGAVVALVLAAAVAWLGAGIVRLAFPGDVARTVGDLRVVRVVDALAPVPRAQVLDRVAAAFAAGGFPHVFTDARDEPVTTVEAADPGAVQGTAVRRASASVVQVVADAPRCGRVQEGSGFVVEDGLVVTNAHVVTGSAQVRVVKGRMRSTATVVAFDPERDVAVLAADTAGIAPLPLAGRVPGRGQSLVVAGYPEGGPLTLRAGRMSKAVTARGHDIHGEGDTWRRVLAVRADIHPGNSGGPLLTTDGQVAGLVFARAAVGTPTAYALRAEEFTPAVDRAAARHVTAVGDCLAD